jgi:hypothetical protein
MFEFSRPSAGPFVSPTLRLLCFPSSDGVFPSVVEKVLRSMSVVTPPRLEEELRARYPSVSVHRRELSGEPTETWYVYRERSFPALSDDTG